MSTEPSSFPYYQFPRFLENIPNITAEHIWIFIIIYDQLRQEPGKSNGYNKTNKWLCEKTKIGLSQLKIKLNDLEKWGLIKREGLRQNRKFYLGAFLIKWG